MKVFVSHSTADREFVESEIVTAIRECGAEPWYAPDNIRSAEIFERSIVAGLEDCDWFLLVLTPKAIESEWVQAEVHWAMQNRRNKIIPVLVQDCRLVDLHLQLLRIQYLDYRGDKAAARAKMQETLTGRSVTPEVAAETEGKDVASLLIGRWSIESIQIAHYTMNIEIEFFPDGRSRSTGHYSGILKRNHPYWVDEEWSFSDGLLKETIHGSSDPKLWPSGFVLQSQVIEVNDRILAVKVVDPFQYSMTYSRVSG